MKAIKLLVFVFLLVIATVAQNTGTGAPPFGSFTGGTPFDVINNQNLNIHLGIPFIGLAGRHTGFSFSQLNDSQIWTPINSGGTTAWTPIVDVNGNPTWGWQSGNPTGTTSSVFATIGTCAVIIPPGAHVNVPMFHVFNMVYTDTGGTPHHFPTVDLTDSCVNNTVVRQPTNSGDGFIGSAGDASGYSLNLNTLTTSPTGVDPGGLVTGPDGTLYYGSVGNGYVEDTNGNFISVSFQSPTTTWADTTGANALAVTTASGSITYKDRNSNVLATVNLETLNIKTNFGCSGVAEYSGTASVPSSIVFPNNQTISFAYEPTPSNSGFFTGRLQKVTLANGGFYEYDYGATNDGINCSDGTTMNLTRKINDGTNTHTWTFSRTGSTTTVTAPQLSYDPAGNDTVYGFDGNGHETSRKNYQGSSASGSILQTISTTWASNGTPATAITILDDGRTQSETDTTYDSNGLLRSTSQYDFGSGGRGALIKTTSQSYLADSNSSYAALNMINLVSNITVKDSTGTARNQMKFGYDEVPIASNLCPTSIAQHDDASFGCTYNLRGNVTSVNAYQDPVTPANPVTKNFTYDVFGNTRTAQLNCCQQQTWVFSSATHYSYPDSGTRGSATGTQLTTRYVYNAPSDGPEGMIKNVTDENGQVTKYGYDMSGRIETITRPDNTQITYTYDDTNHKVTIKTPIDSTHSTQQINAADSMGRLLTATLEDGSGNVSEIVQNQYDELGRPFGRSNPYTGSSPAFFTSTRFDGLGRPTKTILQDGGENTYTYSGQTVTVTDATGRQIRRLSDGAGRLVEVDEPNSASQGTSTSATASVTINGSLNASPTGGGNPPLAASGSPLTSFVASDGSSHAFYLSTNQHVWHLFWNSTASWQNQDLTAITGNTTAAASSKLSSVFDSSGNTHVFYLDTNQHVHELFCCSWQDNDLTAITGSPTAISGSAMTSTGAAQGNTVHLYYQGGNQHLYHMSLSSSGTWSSQDVTAVTGTGSCSCSVVNAPAAGSALTSVVDSSGVSRVYFLSGNQHINETETSGSGWYNTDMTAYLNISAAAAGSALSSTGSAQGATVHVYYQGANLHLNHLFLGWQNQDVTASTGSVSPASGSSLTSMVDNNGLIRTYFLDSNQHVHETWCCNNGSSFDTDMTALTGATPATGSALTSFGMSAGNPVHVHYLGSNQHVWHMYLSGSGWGNQDLFPVATVTLPDSGTVSLNVGGFTATACFGPSTNSACTSQPENTTASQIASALAQALNASNSPVTASVSGSTISVTWKTAGVNDAPVDALSTTHDNPSLFPNPSFTSPATNFSGGASSWFNNAFVTTYTYNVLDQLTGAIAGSQTHSQGYDALGRMTSQTTPEAGNVQFQYNNFNLLTQRTDARGVITNYSYDGLNRLTSKSYTIPNGSGVTAMPSNLCDPTSPTGTNLVANTCFYYDQGGSAAFALGRLTSEADPSGSETYTYDKLGRTTQKQKVIAGTTYNIGFQYNLANEITQIQYPSGRQVKPSFDALGRLAGIADSLGSTNTTYASSFVYTGAQQLSSFNYGNGVTASYGYSPDRLQLTSISYATSALTLFSVSYGYNLNGGNNGQITSIADGVDSGRSATYSYDPMGRLQEASTAGSANYPNWDLGFSYDRYGNRTSETVQPDTSPNAPVPSNQVTVSATANQITTAGYAYDSSGNMTSDGLNTLTYDGENRVSSSSGVSGGAAYVYDAAGLRVKKCAPTCSGSNPSTVYIFSGGRAIAEYDNGAAPGSPSREYINSGTGLLATIDSTGVKYHLRDHLSVRVTTDTNGNKLGEQGGFPFGEAWYSANTTTKWRVASYERDSVETGNDYAQARYYVNRLARFNSPDLFAGSTAFPQTLNRYAYVTGDPVNMFDPTGMDGIPVKVCLLDNSGNDTSHCVGQNSQGGLTGNGEGSINDMTFAQDPFNQFGPWSDPNAQTPILGIDPGKGNAFDDPLGPPTQATDPLSAAGQAFENNLEIETLNASVNSSPERSFTPFPPSVNSIQQVPTVASVSLGFPLAVNRTLGTPPNVPQITPKRGTNSPKGLACVIEAAFALFPSSCNGL